MFFPRRFFTVRRVRAFCLMRGAGMYYDRADKPRQGDECHDRAPVILRTRPFCMKTPCRTVPAMFPQHAGCSRMHRVRRLPVCSCRTASARTAAAPPCSRSTVWMTPKCGFVCCFGRNDRTTARFLLLTNQKRSIRPHKQDGCSFCCGITVCEALQRA